MSTGNARATHSEKPVSRTKLSGRQRPASDKGVHRISGDPANRAEVYRSGVAGQDAIDLLRADHKELRALFAQFDKMQGNSPEKKSLVQQICREFLIHTTIEEEIFYPAARRATGDGEMLDEAEVEHAGAKELIAQLEGMEPDDHQYDAKVGVLGEKIRHHINEEQTYMFPKVKKTKLDLMQLGVQLKTRKDELVAVS